MFATAIPRHVWDPARANPNWSDSYSTDVADRRQWPAKRWSIGLEPRTPTDWLTYSTRNLSYAYNGALRACNSFPEMIGYYQEMKQRGVSIDLDTMNVLLTRAARYESIVADDVFKLFEEMVDLGAKPDLSVVETLHTVFDHHYTATAAGEWRELRRRRLIELYNRLCVEDIATYAGKDVPYLLRSQVARYRENLQSLGSALSPAVMRQYIAQIDDPEFLVRAIHDYLWDFVPKDHPCADIKALGLQIPRVGTILRRPADALRPEDFDDSSLNDVFVAAVERVIDTQMTSRRFPTERTVMLALMSCMWQSGVLVSSTLIAQVMEAVKFSTDDKFRDQDAMRYFTYASRVSVIAKDDPTSSAAWTRLRPIVDARVVARFIAARDPWSSSSFQPGKGGVFAVASTAGQVTATASQPAGALDGSDPAAASRTQPSDLVPIDAPTSASADVSVGYDAQELKRRWAELSALIESTSVLSDGPSSSSTLAEKMEVFTGKVCFLRNAMFPGRYRVARGNRRERTTIAPDVAQAIFELLKDTKLELDVFITKNPTAEPELECVEGMLLIARGLMDLTLLSRVDPDGSTQASSSSISGAGQKAFFATVADMRSQLLLEARSRFDGRFRMLWLQDS